MKKLKALCCENKAPLLLLAAAVLILTSFCTSSSKFLSEKALCERGWQAAENGNYSSAKLYFQEAIKKESNCTEAFIGLAETAKAQWDFDSAIVFYESAIGCYPESTLKGWELGDLYLNVANLYAVTGQMDAGAQLLQNAYDATDDDSFLNITLTPKQLSFSGKIIRDLSPLTEPKWSQIESLSLSNVPNITDYTPIANLQNLKLLRITESNLIDISFIENLYQLETIYLYMNDIIDLDTLKDLRNLKVLDLRHNPKITSIDALAGLDHLNELYLSHTGVTDLSSLQLCKELQIIDISNLESNALPANLSLTRIYAYQTDDSRIKSLAQLYPKAIIYHS